MWLPSTKASVIKKAGGGNGLVAVAIEKDNKGSRHALKWAADNLVSRGQTLILIHLVHSTSPSLSRGSQAIICNTHCSSPSPQRDKIVNITKDLFRTFHCYCSRKDIHCLDVLLEDIDVVKGITEYVSYAAIENLVLGAASRHGFIRFKSSTPSSILKGAPDFCTVYVISKGKISSVRSASRSASHASPLLKHIENLNCENENESDISSNCISLRDNRASLKPSNWQVDSVKSQLGRRLGLSGRSCMDLTESDSDISFVSSDRPSSVRSSSFFCDYIEPGRTSTYSDHSLGSSLMRPEESSRTSFSCSFHNIDEAESDMRRLKLELKQTMEMYSAACREALTAQQKLVEQNNWMIEEEKKLQEAQLAEEAAVAIAEKEKARSKAAKETAEAARKIAKVETNKRASVEMKALKEAEDMRKLLDNLTQTDTRYRKYTIEEIEEATNFFSESQKIGEGGYGLVYKCYLDHTPAAVKVLRQDSAQGKSQFQQEVNILGCIRHPNMVLLLGACAENGILIYEYMANGSLEDCLFGKKEGPSPALCWQLRFGIAAEIATGLLFLHQTKPEPLVHRDLKPGNILLDHNYVSKISDVGLARLLPAVAENVTRCHMTSAAGTFCYIDPEYQQTGMLGVKSDVYSLGIILLQILTGRPAMGLAHLVEESIENGTFSEILDPCVPDWPITQALCLANLALQCAELRRKDRPDLATQVLPQLQILRDYAQDNTTHQPCMQQDVLSEPRSEHSGSSISTSILSTPTEAKEGADDDE